MKMTRDSEFPEFRWLHQARSFHRRLDVCENKSGRLFSDTHRLSMGPGDRGDVVTQLLDKRLNVEAISSSSMMNFRANCWRFRVRRGR